MRTAPDVGRNAAADLALALELVSHAAIENADLPLLLRAAQSLPRDIHVSPLEAKLTAFIRTTFGPGWRDVDPDPPEPEEVRQAAMAAAVAQATYERLNVELRDAALALDEMTGWGHVTLMGGEVWLALGPARDRPAPKPFVVRPLINAAEDLARQRSRAGEDLERATGALINARVRAAESRRPPIQYHHGEAAVAAWVAGGKMTHN